MSTQIISLGFFFYKKKLNKYFKQILSSIYDLLNDRSSEAIIFKIFMTLENGNCNTQNVINKSKLM